MDSRIFPQRYQSSRSFIASYQYPDIFVYNRFRGRLREAWILLIARGIMSSVFLRILFGDAVCSCSALLNPHVSSSSLHFFSRLLRALVRLGCVVSSRGVAVSERTFNSFTFFFSWKFFLSSFTLVDHSFVPAMRHGSLIL